MVAPDPRPRPDGPSAPGWSPPTGSWPSRAPASGRARCRSTRPATRSGPASCGSTPGAGRLSRRAVGGPFGGYAPLAARPLDPAQRRRPLDLGRRPHRPHALPRARARPEVAAAARWYLEPVDYLSMRFTGRGRRHAGVDGRGLADRQPAPRPPRLRPGAGAGRRACPAEKLPPTGADRQRPVGTVLPGRGRRPRARARGRRGRRHPRPPLGGGGRRRRPGAYQAHLAISTTSWVSCPYPRRRPTRSARWPPSRDRARPQPGGQQPGVRRTAPSSGSGTAWRRRDRPEHASYDELTALAAPVGPGQRAGGLHPLAGRRAVPGRRPHGPGRVPQPVAADDPGRRWPGPCWRAWPSTPGGWPRGSSGSSAVRSARSGPSGAGRPRRCGARSTPTSSTGPSNRSPIPVLANLRGSALLAGTGLGAVTARRGPRPWCRWPPPTSPTRSTAALRPAVRRVPEASTAPRSACSPASTAGTGRRGTRCPAPSPGTRGRSGRAGAGPAQQEPLGLVAAHGPHRPQLGLRLDPFGHHGASPACGPGRPPSAMTVPSCPDAPSPDTKLRSTLSRSMGRPCR